MKKISVIVPVYNVEKYISTCLNSILNQTVTDIEIIIVDDGSTDSTLSIVKEFEAKRPDIISVYTQKNSGPAKARNLALSHAKGEFISFIDSDDTIAYDMYEKMYNLAKERDSDLVLCGRAYTDFNGNIMSTWNPISIDDVTNIYQNHSLLGKTSSFVWDKLFKRTIIQDAELCFNEDIHYAEDALFIYSYLVYAKRVCSVTEPLYFYTVQRVGSITGAMDHRMLHEIKACEELTKFYIDKGIFDFFERDLAWICVGFWGRKFYSFYEKKCNKNLNYKFVCRFYDFLKKYYSDWEYYIRKYATGNSKFKYKINKFKPNKLFIWFYIHTPYWFVKLVKKTKKVLSVISKPQKIKMLIKSKKQHKPMYEDYLTEYYKLPVVKNRILYIPNSGDNVAGNPYYLLKDMANRGGFEIYIGSKHPQKAKRVLAKNKVRATVVKMDSSTFQEVLATANYLVTNYRFPTYFTKKDGQILLNTWHGTPLKCLGKHMNSGIKDLGNVQSQFLASDFLLYPNEYTKEKMVDGFMLSELFTHKILVEGYPCNDVFYDSTERNRLKTSLGVAQNRIFVYMPTWRGATVKDAKLKNSVELSTILSDLDDKLDDDIIVYVKLHNLSPNSACMGYKHLRPFPQNLEIYQLLNIADALITDYSSVFYDFSNTRRESILFTYDENEYLAERGLYVDIDSLPFKRIHETEDLADYLNSYTSYEPTEEFNDFLRTYCSHDSAATSRKVNDIILSSHCDTPLTKEYTAVFVSYLYNPCMLLKCENIMQTEKNVVLVIDMRFIDESVMNLLKSEKFKNSVYIVVQNEKILSAKESKLFEKKNALSKASVLKALEREGRRMLPNMRFSKAYNLTNDRLFALLTQFINDANCKNNCEE